MASAKEISNRIKSIKDTMKITRAMYMISSIKLRKAKKNLEETEPYFYGLQGEIAGILYRFPDAVNLFFDNREKDLKEKVKRRGIVVITGDKGMCGAYNHNVLKEAEKLIKDSKKYRLFVVGAVGRNYFYTRNYPLPRDFTYTATNPSIHRARNISETIIELYKKERLDEVWVVYTRMVNSMRSDVEIEEVLPLKQRKFARDEIIKRKQKAQMAHGHLKKLEDIDINVRSEDTDDTVLLSGSDMIIRPSVDDLIEKIVYNYLTGFIYGALVEASACEENARMMAMSNATDNADNILKDLSLEYNKVRQAGITQEITEVIGGAKALKSKN
ncbi:MAG: ATP synthase F1 subunit gamma [Lachnospiraceae bacterium]|nr:ATP synthase F1 subunit gamma [Lachnospiraceae bacterium]